MTKRKKTHTPEEDIQSLEAHLAGTLKPVTPSREVIQRLRGRIQMPNREEITLRLTDWRRLFIVFGGVVSGMLLLITLARAFYYLTGRKDMM
ncbi:MAG: hypothetical protein IPL71_04665 [Anaerolineales bacterium]|uniref:hypothetical protein n=1 Tax=Candidatus Villigracilis proximus TaxID=3140683 RepID=UPI0031356D51|nr:hypothetical protein [Anaerolineales bacterium]